MVHFFDIDLEKDRNKKIWRYIDFAKLSSLVNSHSLFLCRADKFQDDFEGSYPDMNMHRIAGFNTMDFNLTRYDNGLTPRTPTISNQQLRDKMNICCFHMSDNESAAMWELYAMKEQGIAIQSTIGRLHDSINQKIDIAIAKVNYIDYKKDKIPEETDFHPFFHKRIYFEYEKEVRVLLKKDEVKQPEGIIFHESGASLPIDIEKLIENLYLSPTAPDWYNEVIMACLAQSGVKCPICHSDMDMAPIFV